METLNENHFQHQLNAISEGNKSPLYYMVIRPFGEDGVSTLLYTLPSLNDMPDAFFLGYDPSNERKIPMVKMKIQ
jgi:hypothetical protein